MPKPVSETTAANLISDAPPSENKIESSTPVVTAAELLTDKTPEITVAKDAPAEVVPQSAPLTPVSEIVASEVNGAPPTTDETGKYRKATDYENLDWNKTNAQLAREQGVTPQYMGQLRKKLKDRPPTVDGDAPKPDFSDVMPKTEVAAIDYGLMASTVFDMSTGTLTMIFGPEWQPRSPEEKNVVVMSLRSYFEKQQLKDLPPGVILAFVCLGYASTRITAPATKTKLQLAWAWIKHKASSLRRKKPGLAIVPKPTNTAIEA